MADQKMVSVKGTPMTDAMVRVAFKGGYTLMEIADRVRVKLEPDKARELWRALLDAASRAEGGKENEMAKLKSATRNRLPDSEFGLPKQRKYPMEDRGATKLRPRGALPRWSARAN